MVYQKFNLREFWNLTLEKDVVQIVLYIVYK